MELEFGSNHVPEGCRSRDEVLGWARGDNKSQFFPKRYVVEVIQCYTWVWSLRILNVSMNVK